MTPRVDAAAIAIAAHDIAQLVTAMPERLLWTPARAVWGLALVRGGDRVVIAVDGCLDIAASLWPAHVVAGGRYPLDAVVRRLALALPLARLGDATMTVCRMPGSTSGACSVVLARADLPWTTLVTATALRERVEWTAPAEATAAGVAPPLHPWFALAGRAPALHDAATFVAAIGVAPEDAALPPPWRSARVRWSWQRQAAQERARLTAAGHAIPAWLHDDAAIASLAETWCAGWRGDGVEALTQPGSACSSRT